MSSAASLSEPSLPKPSHRLLLQRRGVLASAVVTLIVLIGNATYLLGVRSNDPLLYHSGLGSPVHGLTKARFAHNHAPYTIDPNDGWTAQALGRLAATMWSHGHVPLWNLHEGLGQPLAGEMQSAAFFLPFVLLQLLPNGIFAMHLVLEVVAALSTLGFLRALRLSWVAAGTGAALFGLNGAFSVMTNAPFNPIAFLPMALWGTELVRRALREGRRPASGLALTALALAWSLFAGFPETALVQGFFVACWMLVRLVDSPGVRGRLAVWGLLAALVGAAIAAPILVSLRHFLSFGYTAYHGGDSANWSYDVAKIGGLAMPYLGGSFNVNPVSGGVAGYVTLTALFAAIAGFLGPRGKAFRIVIGGLFVVLLLNMYGFSPANSLLNLIPGMKSVLIYKYALVLVEFIVMLFAALGLDDLVKSRLRRRAVVIATALTLAYSAYGAQDLLRHHRLGEPVWTAVVAGALTTAIIVLGASAWVGARSARRVVPAVVAAVVLVVEGTASYAVPQLAASPPKGVDLAPVHYLEKNLGTSRFYSTGPIQPNYGSYWGLSQLNVDDLPVPQKMSDFIMKDLRPAKGTPAAGVTGWAFIPYELTPLNFTTKDAKDVLRAYGQEQQAYREAGVEYLVTGRDIVTPHDASRYGLVKVLTSPKTEIWRDAEAAPYFTTRGGDCALNSATSTSVTARCSGPAVLTRRQLSSPGWSVSVGSSSHELKDVPGRLYQQVSLPAGTSSVKFSYSPDHFRASLALSWVALAYLLAEAFVAFRRRRSGVHATMTTVPRLSTHGGEAPTRVP